MAKGSKAKAAQAETRRDRTVATNRKARHDYEVLDSWEAGMVLLGPEVKSIRDAKITLRDSYARVEEGEVWVYGVHVTPYLFAREGPDPDRRRKLLLNRHEIDEMGQRIQEAGLTLVPLRVYFAKGIAKLELGLARGRRSYDKRQAMAERDSQREMDRAIKSRGRE